MKYIFLILTWAIQLIAYRTFKESGNGLAVTGICLLAGIVLNFLPAKENVKTRNLGWGLFYGALSFCIVGLAFAIWLSFALDESN